MTTTDFDPQRSPSAYVVKPRIGFWVGVAVAMTLVPVAFGLFGWRREGKLDDLWTGLLLSAVFGLSFGAATLFHARQRVVIDGDAVWVRYLRWRGPIRLSEVVAVQAYASGLVLVQARIGSAIGAWSAANTYDYLRRSRFREVRMQGGPVRYLHLPSFAVQPSVLRLIAKPLLLRPTVMIDEVSRRALADSIKPADSINPAPPMKPAEVMRPPTDRAP